MQPHPLRVGAGRVVFGMRSTALLALVLALGLMGETAAAASTKPCAPRGARLIAASGQAQVLNDKQGRLFACHRRTRKITNLKVDPPGLTGPLRFENAYSLRAAGPFVAFSRETLAREGSGGQINVLDARTGRYKRAVPVPLNFIPGQLLSPTVTDLELSGATGAVGWIARVGYLELLGYEVRRADSQLGKKIRRDSTVLDSAPGINPNSLTLAGPQLSWLRGDEVVTAPFRSTPK